MSKHSDPKSWRDVPLAALRTVAEIIRSRHESQYRSVPPESLGMEQFRYRFAGSLGALGVAEEIERAIALMETEGKERT